MGTAITPPAGFSLEPDTPEITPPAGFTLEPLTPPPKPKTTPEKTPEDHPLNIPDPQETWKKTITGKLVGGSDEWSVPGFAHNVLSSAGNLLGNVVKTIIPYDATNLNDAIPLKRATDTLFDLFSGTGRMAARALGREGLPTDPENLKADQSVQAFRDYVTNRYGSWDKFEEAWYRDPVGMAADLSTLASGLGVVTKGASLAGRIGTLARTGEALTTAGEWTNPLGLPTKLAGKTINWLGTPKRVPAAVQAEPALGDVATQQEAIRQRAFQYSQARTGTPDPMNDWLRAEQDIKNVPSAAPSPAATAARAKLYQNIKSAFGVFGGGVGTFGGIELLTHHLVGSAVSGVLAAGAIHAIPAFLRSSAGQRMLATIGPSSKPAAIAAAARDMIPVLNTLYRTQQKQQPIRLGPVGSPTPLTFDQQPWAKGGRVYPDPELARIQRERLQLPGILEMLQRK